jgi:hypothetical protein
MASFMAILAAIAIPFVPAIFAANGVYMQTENWSEEWRKWAAIATATAIEGAGMFLSILATKTYSAWQKKAATVKEIYAMVTAILIYTVIVVVLITLSDVPWALKAIIALIPLLGVAFYLGMGFEVDLANRLDEAAAEKRRKREERSINRTKNRSKSVQGSLTKEASFEKILGYLNENPDASLSEIGRQIGRPKSTAKNYTDELMQSGRLSRNGHGWEVTL